MVEVDVLAIQDLCTRVVPGMVSRGRGAILNVASTAAFQPLPGQASYAAAKSFVLSYTLSLAGELSGTGVTATCLCPGPVRTGFAERAHQRLGQLPAPFGLRCELRGGRGEAAGGVDGVRRTGRGGRLRPAHPDGKGTPPRGCACAGSGCPGEPGRA